MKITERGKSSVRNKSRRKSRNTRARATSFGHYLIKAEPNKRPGAKYITIKGVKYRIVDRRVRLKIKEGCEVTCSGASEGTRPPVHRKKY